MKTKEWEIKYASFGRRLLAHLIDNSIYIIVSILLVFLVSLTQGQNPLAFFSVNSLKELNKVNGFSPTFVIKILLGFLFVALYDIYFWVHRNGQTPGKRLLAIQIKREDDQKITYSKALIRHFSIYLSRYIFLLGYLWAIWDKKKQTWHDKIAKTIVIETDKKPRVKLAILLFVTLYLAFTAYIALIIGKSIVLTQENIKKQQEIIKENQKFNSNLNDSWDLLDKGEYKLAREKAEGLVSQTRTNNAEKAKVYEIIGEADYGSKNLTEAKKRFEEVIEIDPNYARAYMLLGAIAYKEYNDDQSLKYYRKSIELAPNEPRYHYNFGVTLVSLRQQEEGIAEIKKAIELDPNNKLYKDTLLEIQGSN